jgi:hypothetical protein
MGKVMEKHYTHKYIQHYHATFLMKDSHSYHEKTWHYNYSVLHRICYWQGQCVGINSSLISLYFHGIGHSLHNEIHIQGTQGVEYQTPVSFFQHHALRLLVSSQGRRNIFWMEANTCRRYNQVVRKWNITFHRLHYSIHSN